MLYWVLVLHYFLRSINTSLEKASVLFSTLQYSYLENPMDEGAWWATVHGVAKSRTLNDLAAAAAAPK